MPLKLGLYSLLVSYTSSFVKKMTHSLSLSFFVEVSDSGLHDPRITSSKPVDNYKVT